VWLRSGDLLNFGTPSISGVQIDTRTTVQKCKIRGQIGCGLGHVTYFLILGPLYICETVESINFKFIVQIDYKEYYQKMQK